jgi:superkiller protein 3
VEGLTVSATSALAPKDAKKAYEKGLEAIKKSKPDDAQKEFEKAVELYPKYASAWFELGLVYEQRDHADKAREAYNHSIAADGKYINPQERLYMLAAKDQKWPEVGEMTEKVLRLNPYDFPSAYYFNGLANLQLNNLDAAEKSMREAVKLDARHENPRGNYILGIILAQKHDYPAAAECLRAYLKDVPQAKDAEKVRQQLVELEKVAQAKQN